MKHVLIIDDEPWQAAVYERALKKEFQVDHVTNGFAAIERIDHSLPDVIILDVLLAGSTAWTLIHELRSHGDLAKIPIILATNNSEITTLDLTHYGIVEVLDKGAMHPHDIVHEVRKAIV